MEVKQLDLIKFQELPFAQYLDQTALSTTAQEIQSQSQNKPLTKGKLAFNGILTLVVAAVLGFAFFKYALPIIGVALGYGLIGFGVLCLWFFRGSIKSWFKNTAHRLEVKNVENNPARVLAERKVGLVQLKNDFIVSMANIWNLVSNTKKDAETQAAEAQALEANLMSLDKKAKDLESKIKLNRDPDGDEAIELGITERKLKADINRTISRYNQAKELAHKYAAKGTGMEQLYRNMRKYEGYIDIKIEDFDASVIMLQKDYEFAKSSRAATEAANRISGFNTPWEVDLAMEVMKKMTAIDTAFTASNISDLNRLTSTMSLDDDSSFERLELLTNNIKSGIVKVVDVKEYSKPNYKLTQADKSKIGFDTEMF